MKHKLLGALTILSGLAFAILWFVDKHSGGLPSLPEVHMPEILADWLHSWSLPDWSPVVWTLVSLAFIVWFAFLVFGAYGLARRGIFLKLVGENEFYTFLHGDDTPVRFVSGVKDCFVVQSGESIGEVKKIPAPTPPPVSETAKRKQWEIDTAEYKEYLKGNLWLPMRILENWILMPLFNARWIGIYPFFQLRTYPFSYNKLVKDPSPRSGSIDQHLVPKTGIANSVLYTCITGVQWNDLESAGPENQVIPVKLTLLVEFEVTNVYRAQFRTGTNTWFDVAVSAIKDIMRERVAKHTYFEVLRNEYLDREPIGQGTTPREALLNGVKELVNSGQGNNQSIVQRIGVKVTKISILDVDLGDEIGEQRAELTKATMALTVAEATGKATQKTASYEAAATLLKGNAENKVLEAKLKAYDDHPGAAAGVFADSVGKLSTLVMDGNGTNITIPQPPPRSAPAPKPTGTTT